MFTAESLGNFTVGECPEDTLNCGGTQIKTYFSHLSNWYDNQHGYVFNLFTYRLFSQLFRVVEITDRLSFGLF